MALKRKTFTRAQFLSWVLCDVIDCEQPSAFMAEWVNKDGDIVFCEEHKDRAALGPLNKATGKVAPTLGELIDAARSCALHSVNFDTCGVCGLHFADCEKETVCIGMRGPLRVNGEKVDDGELFTEFECAGARVREVLKKMGDEETILRAGAE